MIEILKAVLIGIVEGITEWLPISSTGHMILLNEFVKLNVSEAFWEMFLVVIQLGAILAVILLYFNRLYPFSRKKSREEKWDTWQLLFKVAVGVIPSAVVGFFLDDWLDEHLYNYITVAISLIVYGVVFLYLDGGQGKHEQHKLEKGGLSYKTAFAIGLFQILSLIPGTSRSGSTIIGGLLLGLSRVDAAEFSFFLAIPTMLGASMLKGAKFVLEGSVITTQETMILVIGCLVAFFVSLAAIKYLINYVRNHSFKAFGTYRIVLGLIVIAWAVIAG